MKNLVIYYSKTGNNEFLAKEIAGRLSCESEAIIEKNKRTGFTLLKEMLFKKLPEINQIGHIEDYDNLILIAPVWGGITATPLISFIAQNKNLIKKYSFITVSGGALGINTKVEEFLERKTGRKPGMTMQLYINDLLPPEQKNKMKYTSSYRIGKKDIDAFEGSIKEFIKACK